MSYVDTIKERLDPHDILEGLGIEEEQELGEWIMCHCPFISNHSNGDTNASFGFNTDTFGYNCFVCGGGDLVTLVRTVINCDVEAAINWLVSISTLEPQKASSLEEKVKKIMHPPQQENILPSYSYSKYMADHRGPVNRFLMQKYVGERGINAEIAERFLLGWSGGHYGITIPHFWDTNLVGWQIRHIMSSENKFYCDTCAPNKAVPKYTNTKNFPKKQTLFLYDEIVSPDVVVVESPMSALYLWSQGIESVATFGSFSMEQAELLKKFDKVKLWPDNDPAGIKNLNRIVLELSKATSVVIVPVVDKAHGDAADISGDNLFEYLFSAYPPTVLPLFKGDLPTLDRVKTVL